VDSDLLQGFYLNGVWVEPLKGEVRNQGRTIHLPPKAMEVLLCLASSPSALVTRERLIERVWGAGQGSQELLGRAISEIRHALDDQADDPRFIQTLPRRGYRLIARPRPASGEQGDGVPPGPARSGNEGRGVLDSLKERGVLETAIAYLVFGWLLIQVADIVFDQLHLPAWGGTFVTVLVIAGFPIALALSWFLEFRDGRAVLDKPSRQDARRRQFSRTYLSVIGAMAIAAVAVFVYDRNIGLPQAPDPADDAPAGEAALPPVQENSIAVLPFLNLDGSSETAIFAHGLVDDVIDRLARVPGLLVSSRGDAYTLEPNSPSSRVRERLRVARYLEGSVQMDGERIRVIVQLIDSATGFHVLSRKFDRPREDFFAIRDQITALTVANLRVALPPGTRTALEGRTDDPSLDVYVLYRRGVEAALLPRSASNLESALGWYEAALTIDPDYAAAHAGKCQAYVQLYPVTYETAHIESAETSCARALQLNPNLDVVHAALGELYTETGRYVEAESAFRQALAVDPDSVTALTGIGEVFLLQEKPDLAEERFRQAIGLHPGDWSAFNSLGYFLYRSGRYVEAAQQYEYVVALDEGNAQGLTNLGSAYMLAGDFAAAEPAFQRAGEVQPGALAHSNLGLLYYYLGRLEDSIAEHRRAVELAPRDHLTWSNLGDALWIGGRVEEAQQAFQTAEGLARSALQVNPNDPGYLMDMAWIMAMLGQAEDAARLIGRARAQSPTDPYVHYYEGLIRQKAGESEAAVAALETAVEEGYSSQLLAADPQLAGLRAQAGFQRIAGKAKPR
jgi:tetratricopeptide (TPR) repeat protein/DNA-binding winged helix-turn-helix (wHTH) protein